MVACPALAPAPGRTASLEAADGVPLSLEHHGEGAPRAVVFAHGFGQTRHAWSDTAVAIAAEGYHCVAADGRGHGDSGWLAGGEYAIDQFVDDARRIARAVPARPVWVGASMGGLLGLLAQGESDAPLFDALVLVDVTPRWETAGVERIMAFMRAHPEGFDSLAHAQAEVAAYLPHRASAKSPDRLRKLLVAMPNGRLRWHWDPSLLDTVARDSVRWQSRLEAAARRLSLPVLLVSGGRSDLVSARTIDEFLALVPHARHASIEDATHMVVGDSNERFTTTILDYLTDLRGQASGPPRGAHRG